jgi:hypothetical protein
MVSFDFRFVNPHSEGINLHFKKAMKLVMCNKYKNLTQILQMVTSNQSSCLCKEKKFVKKM